MEASMRCRASFPLAMVFAAALTLAPGTRNAQAADAERGAALYELRCGTCHSESVHGRQKRAAADFDEIRGWVERWNRSLMLRWDNEEVDDVAVHLNNTYYHYACPSRICKLLTLAPTR